MKTDPELEHGKVEGLQCTQNKHIDESFMMLANRIGKRGRNRHERTGENKERI